MKLTTRQLRSLIKEELGFKYRTTCDIGGEWVTWEHGHEDAEKACRLKARELGLPKGELYSHDRIKGSNLRLVKGGKEKIHKGKHDFTKAAWVTVEFLGSEMNAYVPPEDLWDVFAPGKTIPPGHVLCQIDADSPYRVLKLVKYRKPVW